MSLRACLPVLALLVALPAPAAPLEGDRALAVGASVRSSAWPVEPRPGEVSAEGGVLGMLTDGVLHRAPKAIDDPAYVFFRDAHRVTLTVDLGSVQPIAEIYTHHIATGHRLFLPVLDRFSVSEDGERFRVVGEHRNTTDPGALEVQADTRRFARGSHRFGTGPIRARGRYVRVESVPTGFTRFRAKGTTVGFDEIVVRRGDFDPAELGPANHWARATTPDALPEDVLGLGYGALAWDEMFREGPLFFGATPYTFLRDDRYHLSAGGTFVLVFQSLASRAGPFEDVEFELTLPAGVELVDRNARHDVSSRRDDQGNTAIRVRPIKLSLGTDKELLFFVLRPRPGEPGPLGSARWRWRYRVGSRAYASSGRQLSLVLDPAIRAPAPADFLHGFWLMNLKTRFTEPDATVEALVRYYREIGLNAVWGRSSPAAFRTAEALGMRVVGNAGKRYGHNGYGFAVSNGGIWRPMPDEDRFHFHPELKAASQRYARMNQLCPTRMLEPDFAPVVVGEAKRLLADAHDIYENWEPQAYQKRGCVCDRCKRAFQQATGWSAARVERQWLVCVRDPRCEAHNRFTAQQIADVMALLQQSVSQASRELGRSEPAYFVPAISPKDFDPAGPRIERHGTREAMQALDAFTIWGMPFDIRLGVVDLPGLVGHNLSMQRHLENTFALVGAAGRSRDGRAVPWVANVSGVSLEGGNRFAMPRVYQFQTLLGFFSGLSGHASYHEFGIDARFLRVRAETARILSATEDVVLEGERLAVDARVVSPVPRLRDRRLLFASRHDRGDRRIVAVGNDHVGRVFVELRGLPPGHWRDRASGRSYEAGEGAPLLVDVDAQRFRVLEWTAEPSGGVRIDPADSRAALDAERQGLLALARRIEGGVSPNLLP